MKLLITFLTIIVSLNLSAQIQSGIVTYNVSLDKEKKLKELDGMNLSPGVKLRMADSYKNADDVILKLNFDETTSLSYGETSLRSDNKKISTSMLGRSGAKYNTYVNGKTHKTFKHKPGNGNLLVELPDLQWDLTDETQKIGDYTCYKAITRISVEQFTGSIEREAIAWYAPDIPVSYGPYIYHDLPGLILELYIPMQEIVFKASELNLNPEENIEVAIPDWKVITQAEANQKIKENYGYLEKKN